MLIISSFKFCGFFFDDEHNVYLVGQPLVITKIYENMFSYKFSELTIMFRVTTTVKQCVNVIIKPKGENSTNKYFISICKPKTQVD